MLNRSAIDERVVNFLRVTLYMSVRQKAQFPDTDTIVLSVQGIRAMHLMK